MIQVRDQKGKNEFKELKERMVISCQQTSEKLELIIDYGKSYFKSELPPVMRKG